MLDDELPGQQLPTGPTPDDDVNSADGRVGAQPNPAPDAGADMDADAPVPTAAPRRRAPRRRAGAAASPAAGSPPLDPPVTDEAAGTDRPGVPDTEPAITDEAAGTDRAVLPAVEPAVADELAGTGRPRPARRSARRPAAPAAQAPDPADPETDVAPPANADPAAPDDVATAGNELEPQPTVVEPPPPPTTSRRRRATAAVTFQPPVLTFQPPEVPEPAAAGVGVDESLPEVSDDTDHVSEPGQVDDDESTAARTRRRRGRRGRGRPREDDGAHAGAEGPASAHAGAEGPASPRVDADADAEPAVISTDPAAISVPTPPTDDADTDGGEGEGTATGTRRRRRRRHRGAGEDGEPAAGEPTAKESAAPRSRRAAVTRDRETDGDGVRGVTGSTRLEAKRQRRRDGRDTSRRRTPIVTEAEFLARRESVERTMLVRQNGERTQIAVLEDGVLVEHYVTKASNTSYAGNVYLGKVQNVLPSMEAAFVDVGKGRNAVLYAGEVNYDATGLEGKPRKIEQALKSGQNVLVQVTKDPMGHKGARLTSQISLAGRYLVYVPESSTTGISRKLPDTERSRLKAILKKVVPENAGVIVRTAAEGASEEELSRDVARLEAQWQDIRRKAEKVPASGVPVVLYTEPDLVVRVVRDVFNEDFAELVVQGDSEFDIIKDYVGHVAPDLAPRLSAYDGSRDIFAEYRVDEQLAKALDRKVWLPSGGSLVIDRTEAMVVIDVNTGKFTGKGGDLEETVTKNNLEAAEEIVRQLRLRDLGGMIVVDFIDMVLESNRDLVLRRLTECLGRDRTKHQVAEVTSLGLVQMTRKRVGQGLLEAFSVPCEACNGRGVKVAGEPIDVADVRRPELDQGGRGSVNRPMPVPRPGPPPGYDRADGEPAAAEQPAIEPTEPAVAAVAEQQPELVAADLGAAPTSPAPRRRRGSARRPAGPPVSAVPEPVP